MEAEGKIQSHRGFKGRLSGKCSLSALEGVQECILSLEVWSFESSEAGGYAFGGGDKEDTRW